MIRKDRKTSESRICPECKSELATHSCFHDDVSVIITVCTGFPHCNFFYWSVAENNSHNTSALGELGKWVVKKSLEILHDELPPEKWREALDELRRLNKSKWGDGSG